jgi:nitric oxide reductase NorD protein
MEEQVGALWHRLVTRAARDRHPEAAVRLGDLAPTLGVIFRALGGDGGLRVEPAAATAHGASRKLLQRIAGTGKKVELAWRDSRALRLPTVIDWFPSQVLNKELYIWLVALAAASDEIRGPWLVRNQALTLWVLERWPGLRPRYSELVAAHLAQRPQPSRLHHAEAAQERAVRAALLNPGSVDTLPVASRAPYQVPLWLHPSPPGMDASDAAERDARSTTGADAKTLEERHRRGERSEATEGDRGLITIRMENILTWGAFTKVDRGSEDEDDLEKASQAAEDMDRFHVARDGKTVGSRLRFDLDLPSDACDDRVLSNGILLPEWDWKTQSMQPDYCRILPMEAANSEPAELPRHLRPTAKRLRAQFQQLAPARQWLRGQTDGQEIDLEAYLRYVSERASGQRIAADGLYRDPRSGARDLACLLLADLSLSTDTWIGNEHRVIDVIRDSLFLFSESLAATRDRFGMFGFSSRKRDPVRFHSIKTFDQPYDAGVRGRIQAVKPGFYTRMGAGIRYAAELLKPQPAGRRLLLLLSDGKPNDLDRYEGRYGIEDTRHAVIEARRSGLQPFCVTIDNKGSDYLPHLFGKGGYVVIRRPTDLPKRLPMLYAQLTT